MKDDDLLPLDPELAELFAEERGRPDPNGADAERMLARFDGALVAATLAEGDPPLEQTSDGAVADTSPQPSAATGVSAAGASGLGGATFGIPALIASFVLGTGSGALLHSQLSSPAAPEPVVATATPLTAAPNVTALPTHTDSQVVPQASDSPTVTPSGDSPEGTGQALRPTPSVRLQVPAPSGELDTQGRDRLLAEENALISRAQSALGRGRPSEAVAALAEHQARFSRGQLTEEREALWVQALARAGQSDDAKRRAERFLTRFPRSVFAPSVRAAAGIEP